MKIIVLAAGKSTRFKSRKHKALHNLLGKTILERTLETLWKLYPSQIQFVLGHQLELLAQELKQGETFIEQTEQLGTAHALQIGLSNLQSITEGILVTCIDTPLLRAETLENLIKQTQKSSAQIGLLTAELDNPFGYGRIETINNQIKIIEEKDASTAQKAIKQVNAGVYFFNMPLAQIQAGLKAISNKNSQKEYYLTDMIEWALSQNLKVVSEKCSDSEEILGINSRLDLEKAIQALSQRKIKQLQAEGVSFLNSNSCLIAPEAQIGMDSIIGLNCQILGSTTIGENCQIHNNCFIQDSSIGDDTQIRYSQIVESHIGKACLVGPFANLRPNTQLADNVIVGDFVEIKNSQVAGNSKIPHLSYIGDASIGEQVNIGAGTITANYDAILGIKNKTQIGNNVKVGSNCVLVAPIEIADNCFVAAGSTITESVKTKDSLIIARQKQIVKENWVKEKSLKNFELNR